MNTLVVDFDDVCLDNESANGMSWLYYLKGSFPQFKCTLFTIPGRATLEWLQELNKLDWIQLALHGWNHSEEESVEEWWLDKWTDWGFDLVYKGPNWKAIYDEADILHRKDFILAVKKKYDHPLRQWELTDPRCFHGHIWIQSDFKKLTERITPETEFQFISEVV